MFKKTFSIFSVILVLGSLMLNCQEETEYILTKGMLDQSTEEATILSFLSAIHHGDIKIMRKIYNFSREEEKELKKYFKKFDVEISDIEIKLRKKRRGVAPVSLNDFSVEYRLVEKDKKTGKTERYAKRETFRMMKSDKSKEWIIAWLSGL